MLDTVVLKSLAKDPDQRYATAGELADDLTRLLAGQRVHALPTRRASWRRRTLLAAAGCGIVTLAALVTHNFLRPPTPPAVIDLPSMHNSAGMHLVRIPQGMFWMGSQLGEAGRDRSEELRQVTVNAFFISVTEVTQRQYERILGSPATNQRGVGPDVPVHNVSYRDALEFCRRLSAAEGRTYRLPSEEEWEYACRAGSTRPFFGDGGLDAIAWHADNSGDLPHPCAAKWANGWGLYDVHGNVKEWCEGTFRATNTTIKDSFASVRIVRGGSARSKAHDCRAAAREPREQSYRSPDIGFRVVADIPH